MKGKAKIGQMVEVPAGKLLETTVNLNAGSLIVSAERKVSLAIFAAEKNMDSSRDRIAGITAGKAMVLPSGKYVVIGRKDKKTAEADVEIVAGKLSEVSLTP